MLKTLESQIHFVKEVQKVDTTGVEPLQAIRDETEDAVQEQTITLQDLKPFLDMEEKVGRNGTVRRRKAKRINEEDMTQELPDWTQDLGDASKERRLGRFFFVKREKGKGRKAQGPASRVGNPSETHG